MDRRSFVASLVAMLPLPFLRSARTRWIGVNSGHHVHFRVFNPERGWMDIHEDVEWENDRRTIRFGRLTITQQRVSIFG